MDKKKKTSNFFTKKISLTEIFSKKTFVLIFSFVCSVVIWFYMVITNSLDRPKYIYDIPIVVELSEEAKNMGVEVFEQNVYTATVAISGDSFILDNVTAEDISVVAKLDPVPQKLSANTLQTDTVSVQASKEGNLLANFTVEMVSPEDVSITYDIYEEKSFDIENNIKYTSANDYYVTAPTMSETKVTVSGPESEINKIARVSIDNVIQNPITESMSMNAKLKFYDQSDNEIDILSTHIGISIEEVEVKFKAYSKQTVLLDVTELNVPANFSMERITIEPLTIDIAGERDVVSQYETITLPTAIDFSQINTKNNTFEMEIPMPSSVINISNVETAKVSVNLNGYGETTVSTNQLEFINVPSDKVATLTTQALSVNIVAADAQLSKILSTSVYGTIDMAGFADINGSVEVPVAVKISGVDHSWVYGSYTVIVNISDKPVESEPSTSVTQP